MAVGTTFKIAFDGKAVRAGLASVRNSVKSIASAAAGIAKLGSAIVAVGIAGAAAIGGIAYKINLIGEAAITSENRVKNIVKQMGLFGDQSDDVAQRLINLSKVTARQTGIDEKSIEMTQAKLATFKELAESADIAGGAFDRATTAAIDMAAAGFGEAEQNAVQLGKALNDPIKGINSLTRSGITFTAQEKKMIAGMVEMGKMGQAQNVILKAIETQVGGTALATADASQQIKVSIGQVIESFAKPFSTGFSSLPGMMENVFPQLIERAKYYGQLFANAITDAINGNYDKFVAAGKLIGDVMGAAATAAFQSASSGVVTSAENLMRDQINKTREALMFPGAKETALPMMQGNSFSDLLQANLQNRNVASQIKQIAAGTQGLVPNSGGRFQYAAPGQATSFRDSAGNPVVEVLRKIENNTSQGAKM